MKVQRLDKTFIYKRKINFKNIDIYDINKINLISNLLNEEINNTFIDQFEYVSFVLNNKSKYNINSGCVSQIKHLKSVLKKHEIITYPVSTKASNFSTELGDKIIKEAHMFLIYPTIKNNKLLFNIIDPGLRVKNIVSFYDKSDSVNYKYLNTGLINVKYINKEYPYSLNINKRLNYEHHEINTNVSFEFNTYFETIDLNNYDKKAFEVIYSLKLMNYPKDNDKYIYIRSKIFDKTIDIFTCKIKHTFTYDELSNKNKKELNKIFNPYFINTNISKYRFYKFINCIYLLIHNREEYIEKVINKDFLEDYKKRV